MKGEVKNDAKINRLDSTDFTLLRIRNWDPVLFDPWIKIQNKFFQMIKFFVN